MPEANPPGPCAFWAGHVHTLLNAPVAPDFPGDGPDAAAWRPTHDYLCALRDVLAAFARGDFSPDIALRGVVAGRLKALQAAMHHLTWQIQRVAEGDFDQHIDFLGDFSTAFNTMVKQLDGALTALRTKEAELRTLTRSLEREVEQRGEALKALRESERHLRYLAEHDPLTGLLNRRSFFSVVEMNLRRSALTDTVCCGAIFDIDHFKRFNDTYGHLNGDRTLKHVAKVAQSKLRASDLIGRYGGEEFVLYFDRVDIGLGMVAAERVRAAIEASPVTMDDGRVATVTVSMGVVELTPDILRTHGDQTVSRALEAADAALYRAKRDGRNRVRQADPPSAPDLA